MTKSAKTHRSKGSAIVEYKGVDSDDVSARIAGYLSFSGANVMAYSPQRREMVERIFRFMRAMPYYLSYHDQITCLLYLLNGKFVRLPRLLYAYDVGPWEEANSAQKRDVDFYRVAGLDPAINKFTLVSLRLRGRRAHSKFEYLPRLSAGQRQAMSDQWFSIMFLRFTNNPRLTFDSAFAADSLCQKLRASQGRLSFQDILADICRFIALFSQDNAQSYFAFWNEVLNRRNPIVASAR